MIRAAYALLAALTALAVLDARPAAAETIRPWCIEYLGGISGGHHCSFISYEQCMETARGNGAHCSQNPMYQQPGRGAEGAGRSDRPRRR